MGTPLNQAVFAGSYSIRAPRRSTSAMAGLIVAGLAGAAFWLGFSAERNRPMPVAGAPLAAISAVPLQHDQLAQLIYPQAALASEVPPAKAAAADAAPPLFAANTPVARPVAFSVASSDVRAAAAEIGPAAPATPVADVRPAGTRDPVGDLLVSSVY